MAARVSPTCLASLPSRPPGQPRVKADAVSMIQMLSAGEVFIWRLYRPWPQPTSLIEKELLAIWRFHGTEPSMKREVWQRIWNLQVGEQRRR